MEPSALKSPVSKINILPHLTKKATAEQHELKDHLSLNRGSKWHSRERLLPPGVDTCLFRRLTLTARQDLCRGLSSRSELCELSFIYWNLCSTLGVVWTPACPLINETEGDRDHTPDTDFLGFPTKMLTVKRLGGSNACYRSDQLEKMAFFQCMEEVEKCFLEESSGEQDSRSGKNQAKEQAWSLPGLQETAPAAGERTAAPAADALAPPAPFDHRIVTARQAAVNSFYTVSRTEILGGGRFGQVHKCEEKATGLKLAAKIIKTRGVKDKDDVKNEISVMNQLDHVNLIQLYDAFESKNDIVLVMEYVGGGELFDRIIDDNCSLTELDTILFIRQICEGIRHMHQMYILHLDLKPENILCVNRDTKQIKIIDFGLARRYKPRERLKVNFGTPEFLAPEVVNYDFVSFPTDMWSVGVITYMLLSGLSPFLGDDDAETLNNILACRWDLEDQEFQDISEEAREFISKLLIKEKSWRISASEALKHPWLADHKLHSRLSTQKRKNCCSDAQDLATK